MTVKWEGDGYSWRQSPRDSIYEQYDEIGESRSEENSREQWESRPTARIPRFWGNSLRVIRLRDKLKRQGSLFSAEVQGSPF